MSDDETELTYAKAGVDLDASEATTAALVSAVDREDTDSYAGTLALGDQTLGLVTDGVGTKLLVAEAIGDYSTIGIDCVAMNVNDLVATGIEPLGFVDYLAMEQPDDELAAAIGEGLARGAELADISILGGETAVLPEVVSGFDLAGACVGLAPTAGLFPGTASEGNKLVGFPSAGIHSNGLTLARQAVTRRYEYSDPFPPDPRRTVGEVLLEPTAIYTDLLTRLRETNVTAAAHLTGGGWTNLLRLGENRYVIDDPLPIQSIFEFVRSEGNIDSAEMHRTFNMGTGFVAAVPESHVSDLVDRTNGRAIGTVEAGEGIHIRDVTLLSN